MDAETGFCCLLRSPGIEVMTEKLKIWHPFTQAHLDPAPLRVVRASGVYLYTDDGRKILDAISSWWVNLHVHCHPKISAAVAEQAQVLDHVLLAGFRHPNVEAVAAKLRKFLPPALEHIFFSDNGSTAVEVALKLAVQYLQNRGQNNKKKNGALEPAHYCETVC